MKLPKQFIIHGHTIKVIQKEIDDANSNRYGYYDSVREEIVIFNKVRSDNNPVNLTETQIEATFWHELIHCFQWHIKGDTDEWEAQSYAGLMIEFMRTSGIKVNPDIIHEPINDDYED